jgi:hypothetical protein
MTTLYESHSGTKGHVQLKTPSLQRSSAVTVEDSLPKLTLQFCICIKEKDVLSHDPRAHNSAVECHPHTVEVVGSNPTAPTIFPVLSENSLGRPRWSVVREVSIFRQSAGPQKE